jgi:hypothetical protein
MAEDIYKLSVSQTKALQALDRELRDLYIQRDQIAGEIVEAHNMPQGTRVEVVDLVSGKVRLVAPEAPKE